MTWGANGKLLGEMACTLVDGRIVEILSVSAPERLASMGLPDPARQARARPTAAARRPGLQTSALRAIRGRYGYSASTALTFQPADVRVSVIRTRFRSTRGPVTCVLVVT